MTSGIIALILDFAAGYGVREWISAADAKRRRIGGMLGVQTRPRTSRAPADSSAAIRYPAGPVWPVRDRMHFRQLKRREFIALLGGSLCTSAQI